MKWLNPIPLLLILIGALMIGVVLWLEPSSEPPPLESLANMQTADAPLPLPEDGLPRLRLHLFSPWQLAAIPPSPRFDMPLGTADGALTSNARPFGTVDEETGLAHTGDDLNGIGGPNADLGDPVFASADGLVVYAGEPSPDWGRVLVLAHRAPDGRILQSLYGHLARIDVPLGVRVGRGQVVGQLGSAGGRRPAHLHFELRDAAGVVIGDGARQPPLAGMLDPTATIEALRGAPSDRPAPSMLPEALEKRGAWNAVEIGNADRLGEILGE